MEKCRDAGLVRWRELFIDTIKVRANADIDSLVPAGIRRRNSMSMPRSRSLIQVGYCRIS